MKTYVTKGGEMLDEICFAHYGNDKQSDNVLRANRGLEQQPFRLPAGIEISLPEQAIEKEQRVKLW